MSSESSATDCSSSAIAMVSDCTDECVPKSYLGDGVCDRGSRNGVNFNCAEKQFDGGDCTSAGKDTDTSTSNGSGNSLGNVFANAHANVSKSMGNKSTRIILVLLILTCACRAYYKRSADNKPPSWANTGTKVRYQRGFDSKDMEAGLPDSSTFNNGGTDAIDNPSAGDAPKTPSYSEFKKQKQQSGGSSSGSSAGSGAAGRHQLPDADEFDAFMEQRE